MMKGSKSSIGRRGIQLQDYQQEGEESNGGVFHSSWIRRLLRPSPPSSPIQPTQIKPSPFQPTQINPFPIQSKIFFRRRILKLLKANPHLRTKKLSPLRLNREIWLAKGFGPFQIRKMRNLVDLGVGSDGHNGTMGLNEGSKNSNGDVGFAASLQRMSLIEKEEERENNFPIKDNWFPPNHRKQFTEKNFLRSERNFINNNSNCAGRSEGVISVIQRRVIEDHYSISDSAFFRYWSALKKNDYSTENRSNDDVANKLSLDSHLTHHNVVLQHERQQAPTYPSERAEPSSFGNTNNSKISETVSSLFQVCRSGSRKRNSEMDKFISSKSQKSGLEKQQVGWPFTRCKISQQEL